MTSQSVSFDRAAEFYDETRADPPHVANALTEALLTELGKAGADGVLEIGIGTGRIARPLAERGIRVTGFDIAPRMVAKLREQLTPQHIEPDVSFGDATALPVKDASFKAVLGVHILHLVSSLEGAVAEIRRALAPDGIFLSPYQRPVGESPWKAEWEKWEELISESGYVPRKRSGEAEINAALTEALGSSELRVYATREERWTADQQLQRIRDRIDSWSWQYPDDVFESTLAKLEDWYPSRYPDMDQEYAQTNEYVLVVFRRHA
jgi:ubiquinone/menaquinone biosynthesis C-methylase UbiE